MKTYFFSTLLLLFISLNGFCQKSDEFPSFEKFYSSISETLKYPPELRDSCIATIALMKVNFNSNGGTPTISFSDSAHDSFVKYVQNIKGKLDFNSIYVDLKKKGYESKTVLIPLQFDSEKIFECNSAISSSTIMKLYLFDGKPCSGEYVMYPSVYFKVVVGQTHE
ncbi:MULTISPECIES: hypothetical protein [unclassified Sphingobacterium]|uniref:hypothetical protein n=1 Tax=unclassified Sphingobacterium TaxID=2609468 RepID=UPI00104E6E97|nr:MULTISPECIES: hypothetical protein [unclassified Sphingobacterium]MCS3557613.1 hypothetical protein [Sphingobacterium sp. JUb21]TCQ95388.1 hypothetical protein EDF66_12922 [Sphingobacterium sp. JUb20]